MNSQDLAVFFIALLTGVGIFQTHKALPPGISYEGPMRPVHTIQFYRDLTWAGPDGNRQTDHEIFDAVFDIIHHARKMILIDIPTRLWTPQNTN